MSKFINKVVIVGGSGTGKSTLAKNLGKQLNLPVYHLDGIKRRNRKYTKKESRKRSTYF